MIIKSSKYSRYFGTLILVAFASILSGQASLPYRFTNYTLEDGLADNWCYDALMDSYGYMWFATQDGLSLFDGVKFSNFQYLEDDSTSIGGNNIMELMEGNGGLWIASNGGGLNFYDRKKETFTSYTTSADKTTISANTAVCLFEDADSIIWVGTFDKGFNRFDFKSGTFKRFALTENTEHMKEAFEKNSVRDIIADKENPDLLWLATNNGLYSFNKKSEQLEYWSSPLIEGETLNCHKIHYSNSNELLVAVAGAGISRFNTKTKKWKPYPSEMHWWESGNKYGNLIFDLEPKSEQEWWVAHLKKGLGIFNEQTGTYTFAKHDPADPYSVISDFGFGVYTDLENRLWYLSFQAGVSFLDPSYQMFNYQALKSESCPREVSNVVKTFAYDIKTGNTYVGSEGCDGLYIYNKDYKLINKNPHRQLTERQRVYEDIFIDSRGIVWVLSLTGWDKTALLQYDSKSGFCTPFSHNGLQELPLNTFELTDIIEDREHNIWLATEFQGLIKIDFQADTLIQYLGRRTDSGFLCATLQMSELLLDQEGKIWIATLGDGVFVFDPQQATFLQYGVDFGDEKGLADRRILALEEDYLGRIWVGTNTHGVQLIDPKKKALKSYRRQDGLPGEHIGKIRRDSSGNIWLATNKGLCKYDIKEKSFTSFGKKEGLAAPDFTGKGMEIGANGTLYLGQTWGFYNFHPDSVFFNKKPPPVHLTSFKVFGKDKKFGQNINFLKHIRLNHDENFFTIGFNCLNFSIPAKNKYAYRLEGFDKEWVYPFDKQAIATYTNVDPGHYTFSVRAANNDGIWNDFGHSLNIYIAPPFWQTNWFYALCTLFVLSFLFLFYRWRLNTIKGKAQVETRLAELELKALRSQMNPHFIFNSLNAIKLLIQSERKDEAGDYLTKFSKMIRGVLHHSDRKMISLSEELEVAKLFLSMEALRFQHKFEYEIKICDDLDPDMINVPPLIFQPYLENAIWHGLMHLEKEGRVSLSIQKNKDLIQCLIDDNGIGREMAQRINSKRRSRHKSVGISITQERLRLNRKLDNSNMGVEIIDKKNEDGQATGTTIIINLN